MPSSAIVASMAGQRPSRRRRRGRATAPRRSRTTPAAPPCSCAMAPPASARPARHVQIGHRPAARHVAQMSFTRVGAGGRACPPWARGSGSHSPKGPSPRPLRKTPYRADRARCAGTLCPCPALQTATVFGGFPKETHSIVIHRLKASLPSPPRRASSLGPAAAGAPCAERAGKLPQLAAS